MTSCGCMSSDCRELRDCEELRGCFELKEWEE